MPVLISWGLKMLGLNITKAIALAAVETLVKNTKTTYDDEILASVKKTMKWE